MQFRRETCIFGANDPSAFVRDWFDKLERDRATADPTQARTLLCLEISPAVAAAFELLLRAADVMMHRTHGYSAWNQAWPTGRVALQPDAIELSVASATVCRPGTPTPN